MKLTHFERRREIAVYWCWRFRQLRRDEGTVVAATRLKKYGVPIHIALRVLGIDPSHFPALRPRAQRTESVE